MDILSNLKFAPGSNKKKKRVGRGQGSGHGGTSTRGENGQHSRSGAKFRAWFEGGQMPLSRRVPKFGFTSPNRVEFQVLNVSQLDYFIQKGKISTDDITPDVLYKSGIISKSLAPLKILGEGEIKSKINISAHSFSKAAKEKIEAAGGQIKIITE
jgi:large subunit ribosomal protein L15